MEKVDKNSAIPLHTQLSSIIRKMIEKGALKEGALALKLKRNFYNVDGQPIEYTISI